ncbi:MFS transporter [Saccharolobus caldissimus]|uniref:MFS transporter n=1 Tax=Saccharolobus caldissimus TaxID=1702097 RepID=A0AAQ4CRF8_9CREN|nr:MFS transporter [Saccharolobus caldissimus]BDB98389.1 MFS transporter [Saccharolobus caldissimus]
MSVKDKENKQVIAAATVKGRIIPRNVPRIAWYALIMAWLAYATQIIARIGIFNIEPIYASFYHLSPLLTLSIPAIWTILAATLSIPISNMSDRKGGGFHRRHYYLLFLTGYILILGLIAFKPIISSFAVFFALLILSAIIASPLEPLIVASAGDWFPIEHRGFALGFHHTGYPWGSLIGGFLISMLLVIFGENNWPIVFLLPGSLAVILAIVLYKVFTLENQRKLEIECQKRGLHASLAHEFLPSEMGQEKKELGYREAFGLLLKNPTELTMLIVGFLVTGAYWVWAGFLPLYLYYILHYSAAETAFLSVVFTATGGLGQIIWGALSDKIGRKLSLIITTLWFALGVYTVVALAGLGLGVLIGAQLFAGLATNATYPLMYAIGYDVADKRAKATSTAFIDVAFYLGGALLFVTGYLIEIGGGYYSITGYLLNTYFLIGILVGSAILTLVFARETSGWFFKKDWSIFPRRMSNLPELEGESK